MGRKNIIIAVDGFSGCGKSTFARAVAARIGYVFIDTGSMYRAVTLYGLENGAIERGEVNEEKLKKMLPEINITFRFNAGRGVSDIYLNGRNVEDDIRTIGVSEVVSSVSSISEVRARLVRIQQDMGREKGIVMDGRDIGTVVFPHAELKIFMTADTEVRVERRYRELLEKGEKVSREDIRKNLAERDYADQHREISPLRMADDALLLDNSQMTLEEEVEWAMEKINALTL